MTRGLVVGARGLLVSIMSSQRKSHIQVTYLLSSFELFSLFFIVFHEKFSVCFFFLCFVSFESRQRLFCLLNGFFLSLKECLRFIGSWIKPQIVILKRWFSALISPFCQQSLIHLEASLKINLINNSTNSNR